MPAYEPNLPARQVHDRFSRTLREAESVRKNLVLWFADLYRRKLYLELGYTSVYAYTAERHGFSRSRCTQFIRLAESLSRLPALRESLAAGEMPWTKAREVVRVATPGTERAWVDEARRSSRRELERKVAAARGCATADRNSARGQGRLALAVDPGDWAGMKAGGSMKGSRDTKVGRDTKETWNTQDGRGTRDARRMDDHTGKGPNGSACDSALGVPAALVREIPEEVRLHFSALRYAEYGALVEKLRKLGRREPVEDLIVAGLAALAAEGRVPARKPSAPDAGHDSPSDPARESLAGIGGDERAEGAAPRAPAGTGWNGAAEETQSEIPVERVRMRTRMRTRVLTGGEPASAAGSANVHSRVPTGEGPGTATALPEARARGFTGTPYQVVIRQCETCGKGEVVTGRGPRPLHPAELRAVLCDARIHEPGRRNRATIPPARRREVLERDDHRCRVPGCGSAHFLSVHHVEPRAAGGSNASGNLVTLCAGCHRAVHELAEPAGHRFLRQLVRDPP
jgi:5-methylcytosine-specific restriction endonuclease McrA